MTATHVAFKFYTNYKQEKHRRATFLLRPKKYKQQRNTHDGNDEVMSERVHLKAKIKTITSGN